MEHESLSVLTPSERMSVALIVGSLVAIAIWIAALAILIGSVLNRIGAPV
jgi:hypothetical protein